MQQLQNSSDAEKCARGVLETVLTLLVNIRETAARRQSKARGKESGCSLMHVRALGVIRKRPGATLSEVADQLGLTLSATSRLIDLLVLQQLVRREIPSGNRRKVSLDLTAAGGRKLDAAMRQTERELAPMLAQLTAAQAKQVCGAMDILRNLFERA